MTAASDPYYCRRCDMHPTACRCEGGPTPAHPVSHPTNPRIRAVATEEAPNADSGISGTPIEEWEDPIPVDAPPLPPFPVERLGKLGEFVKHGATSLQVPPDLLAFACLAVLSICTGGHVYVEVKPGWTETLALYLAALADSSEKKTPALNLAAQPLRECETTLIEAKRPEIEAKAQEIRITQAEMAKAEQKAAGDKPGNARAEAEAARMRLLKLGDVPALPRLLIRDATLEALSKVMATQGGRIGLLASEGGLLKVAAGLYGNNGKANTDLLLEAYSGGPYTIDRSGGTNLHMPWTFLAIGLIMQPGILTGIEKKNPEFRENGLLGRFLYCLPPPSESDTFDAPSIPLDVFNEYDRHIRDMLCELYPPMEGRFRVVLSEEARELFSAYYNEFAKRRKPGGDLHDIADWAGKFRGQLIRIAACLSLYDDPQGGRTITGERMADVLAMAPYFIAHARAVFDLMGADHTGRTKPLRDLLAWLRARKKPETEFTARDAWQALKGRKWAASMDDMSAALAELEDYGWIALQPAPETPGRRGRKASPRYEVHPWIYDPPKEDK
ncbi:YfjI family protein [Actinoallomurus sp. NPDC052274]|uniref:YfjI family protein n=1 Tax=Actinoallomurus sp. NPDC052274 TaxID=3155420 RepID=UPI0034257EAC